MNIVVIGASNSVMRDNYIEAIGLRHNVKNFSSGRNPINYYIKVVLENEELINCCDLLIIDHVVNDINFYLSSAKFVSEYKLHLENFYSYLASIKIPVINIFFPILGVLNNDLKHGYYYLLGLNEKFGIPFVDLNKLDLPDRFFIDKYHMKREFSFVLGLYLISILNDFVKREAECCLNKVGTELCSFYSFIKVSSIVSSKLKKYKNSLIDTVYLDGGDAVYLNFCCYSDDIEFDNIKATDYLISFGYLNFDEVVNHFSIDIKGGRLDYAVSGKGYYHEALDRCLLAKDIIGFDLIGNKNKKEILLGRKLGVNFKDELYPCEPLNLVELLFYRGVEVPFFEDKVCCSFAFDYSELERVFYCSSPGLNGALNIDDKKHIKKASIFLREFDQRLSRKLMGISKR